MTSAMPPAGSSRRLPRALEDDLSIREAVRSFIRSLGPRCETFATAAERLRAYGLTTRFEIHE